MISRACKYEVQTQFPLIKTREFLEHSGLCTSAQRYFIFDSGMFYLKLITDKRAFVIRVVQDERDQVVTLHMSCPGGRIELVALSTPRPLWVRSNAGPTATCATPYPFFHSKHSRAHRGVSAFIKKDWTHHASGFELRVAKPSALYPIHWSVLKCVQIQDFSASPLFRK